MSTSTILTILIGTVTIIKETLDSEKE